MAKINISIDDELLARVDKVADANYMSRSGLISTAVAQWINTSEMVMAVCDISVAIRKIADSGNIDADTMRQLEDYERICKMMAGK